MSKKRKLPFSEKHGHSNINLQLNNMDDSLRTDIWNVIYTVMTTMWIHDDNFRNTKVLKPECKNLWVFLGKRINNFPNPLLYILLIEEIYDSLEWFKVYDLIEHFCFLLQDNENISKFREWVNDILEKNKAAYILVNDIITPIIDQNIIDEIENTFDILEKDSFTYNHLLNAQKNFSDRKAPNYRISCNESLQALEAFLRERLQNNNIFSINKKELSKKSPEYQRFWDALEKFYAIRNDNTAHAEKDKDPAFTLQDAIFIHRTTCSWIAYIDSKLIEKTIVHSNPEQVSNVAQMS